MTIKETDPIMEEVLTIVNREPTAATTREIALEIGCEWKTVYKKLEQLEKMGKIKGEKRPNGFFWSKKNKRKVNKTE